MTFLTDSRLLASITTAAFTAYDTLSIATWSLLFWIAARRSRRNLSRDLF